VSGGAGASVDPTVVATGLAAGPVYVAWADARYGNYEIYLSRYDAGGWSMIGGSAQLGGVTDSADQSRRPSLALGATDGPMLAWTELAGTGSDIHVARFDPAANGGLGGWAAMGGSLGPGGISGTGLADHAVILDTPGGPAVFWIDGAAGTRQVYAKQFNGAAWVEFSPGSAGGGGLTNAADDVNSLAAAAEGASVALAWSQGAGSDEQVFLLEHSAGVWGELAGSGSGNGVSDTAGRSALPTLAYHAGELFAAWQQQTVYNQEVCARRFDGVAWQPAGAGAAAEAGTSRTTGRARAAKLATGGGRLTLAWIDDTVGGGQGHASGLFVRQWRAGAFAEDLPGDVTDRGVLPDSTIVRATALALDGGGHAHAVWEDVLTESPGVRHSYLAKANKQKRKELTADFTD